MKKLIFLFVAFIVGHAANAQQPKYTKKLLITTYTPNLFSVIKPPKNGIARTYLEDEALIWDVDDNNTTHINASLKVLMKVEGNYKNGKRNGVFVFTVLDSLDPKKEYKLYEQTFQNDRLTGVWKTFNLKGTVIQEQYYVNDTAKGLSILYWIDGKRIMRKTDVMDGQRKYIEYRYDEKGTLLSAVTIENGKANGLQTKYYANGKPERTIMLVNEVPTGAGKSFYEDGSLMEDVNLLNGQFHGSRKYYYPNGQLWIEEIYNKGLHWTVIANYDAKGNKRNAGTLKDGNGTLILYNEDGTARETVTYLNGREQ